MNELKHIPLADIQPNPAKLREVDTESAKFQGIIASIKDIGVLNAVNVRLMTDDESGETYYELVDGFHRFTACQAAGLDSIPAQVLDIASEGEEAEGQVLAAQIMANVQRVETKPVEYATQLLRMLNLNPMLSQAELAGQLNVSTDWLSKTLKLTKIESIEIKEAIDDSRISLSNAYALSQLPPEEQINLLDDAITEDPKAFAQTVNARKKEIKEANRAGRETKAAEFVPRPRMKNLKAVTEACENDSLISSIIAESGASDPADVFKLALDYVRHIDPATLATEKADWETKEAVKAEKKQQKLQAAALKRAEAAQAKAAEAAKEAQALSGDAPAEEAPVETEG